MNYYKFVIWRASDTTYAPLCGSKIKMTGRKIAGHLTFPLARLTDASQAVVHRTTIGAVITFA